MRTSAIISAYFAKEYLEGRIENLLQQTERPEIIVVCQRDSREEEIALSYLPKTENFWIQHTLDIPTIYRAWNLGISLSHGKFITNANSDDRLKSNSLKVMADLLESSPKYAVLYGNQDVAKTIDGEIVTKYEWIEGGLKELMKGCFVGPMPLWRRELHDKYGGFDEEMHIAGDYEFWLRIASKGERFYHLRAIVGTYLDRPESAEHREKLRATWETARARARYGKEVTP